MKRKELCNCKNCGQLYAAKVTRTNHVMHAIFSILTLGVWLVVWLIMMMEAGAKNAVSGRICPMCAKKRKRWFA